MRFDFIPGRSRWVNRTAVRQSRGSRRVALELETLEGRVVLSHLAVHQAAIAHHQAIVASRLATNAAVSQAAASASSSGLVTKIPAFNDLYTGPQRADLNVKAASVRFVPARGFILTAQMVGPINTNPATEADQSYYVFGIDRGSPNAVAPFSNQPNIFLDATVTVSVLKGGISVGVRDLVRANSTTVNFLPSNDLKIVGRKLQVTVKTSLLPIPDQGFPINMYQFSMYPANGINVSSQTLIDGSVASFIPPDSEAPIGVPHGFTG